MKEKNKKEQYIEIPTPAEHRLDDKKLLDEYKANFQKWRVNILTYTDCLRDLLKELEEERLNGKRRNGLPNEIMHYVINIEEIVNKLDRLNKNQ